MELTKLEKGDETTCLRIMKDKLLIIPKKFRFLSNINATAEANSKTNVSIFQSGLDRNTIGQ